MNTGLRTNFDNGDFTTFDDAASATSINITGAVTLIPNNVTVTNNLNYYTFGGGSLAGGATITKAGTNTLEIDAQVTLGVQVNQGLVTGSGASGSVNISAGGDWNYSGTVNGNVTCAGLGVNNGTINGPLTVGSGGVFTNLNSLSGTFTTQAGGWLYNGGSISSATGSTLTVATNSTFVNGGTIVADLISVVGTFEDLGALSNDKWTSITVASGGTLIPGGPGIGTTVINSDGLGNYPGAVLLSQGSVTVFNVNWANPQTNTILSCGHISFGASASAQTQNGGTIQINNIGSTPFSAGQYYGLFVNSESPGSQLFNTGSSTNTYPVISPASPGAGLTWDLSQIWVNGTIGVIPANSGPVLTSSFGIDATGTNMVAQFSWSQTYGAETVQYRLETQVNPLSIGLSNNWTGVSGSWTNTTETLTNVLGGNNCVFYRLVFP